MLHKAGLKPPPLVQQKDGPSNPGYLVHVLESEKDSDVDVWGPLLEKAVMWMNERGAD